MNDVIPGAVENLQPWIVAGPDGPACWQLANQQVAVALFSSAELAGDYAKQNDLDDAELIQPEATDLVRMLVLCKKAGVESAVVNPSGDSAQRVFNLTEVLSRVREDLRAGRPLQF